MIALGMLTVSRNTAYRSEVALWEDTVRKSPWKARGWNNLGYAYQQAGRFRDAEAAYLRALRVDPGYAPRPGEPQGTEGEIGFRSLTILPLGSRGIARLRNPPGPLP